MRVPFPLAGDAYTVAGQAIASPQAREKSVYNLTNRRSPAEAWPGVAYDARMVFFGLSHWVRNCVPRGHALSPEKIELSNQFMRRFHSFGGGLNFDPDVWYASLKQFGGRLPIRIEALPEGSTFWPNEPVVQVTSLGSGFGEVAALIEATLLGMVACATARATVTRHLLERMGDEVKKDNPDGKSSDQVTEAASWLVHDFGMRASSTPLEAEIFGLAHLLSFRGTDTTPAAYSAWESDGDDLGSVGTSILAHAHRIILGYETEAEAVSALADACENAGDFPIASYLSDTYEFRHFVTSLAVPLALEYQRRGRGVVVVRPDSGDYLLNDEFVISQALAKGLCAYDGRHRPAATHLKLIQGDSMNPEKIQAVLGFRRNYMGVNATSWGGFGIGGWLRAQGNRDLLSSAYKLAAKGAGDEPVVKLSETPAKMSVPGVVDLYRDDAFLNTPTVFHRGTRSGYPSRYVTYYDGGIDADAPMVEEPFINKRRRAVEGFHSFRFVSPTKGSPEEPVLGPEIREVQQRVYDTHRGKS